jgi:excisionase family DNA binding protein
MTRDPWLTVADVAFLWASSTKTVLRRIKAGTLPAGKLGRSYRVRYQDAVAAITPAEGTPRAPEPESDDLQE